MRVSPVQCALLAAAEGENKVGYQEVVFAALLFCCFAIVVVEITRRMQPEVTIEKLVALAIGVCYLVVTVVAGCVAGVPLIHLATGVGQLLLALAGSLALIWFDEVIGDLVGLRAGLVSKASPGFLIRLMGWVFLLGIIGVTLYFGWG